METYFELAGPEKVVRAFLERFVVDPVDTKDAELLSNAVVCGGTFATGNSRWTRLTNSCTSMRTTVKSWPSSKMTTSVGIITTVATRSSRTTNNCAIPFSKRIIKRFCGTSNR